MWVIMVVRQLMLPRDSLKSIVSLLSLQSGFKIVISKGQGRVSNGTLVHGKKHKRKKKYIYILEMPELPCLIGEWTNSYLYGTCLAPFAKAMMTFPSAFRDKHRPPPPSLLLLSTFSQLPRSMRCSLLLPPDTVPMTRGKPGEHRADTPSRETTPHTHGI